MNDRDVPSSMGACTQAVIEAGLVPQELLPQFQKWGVLEQYDPAQALSSIEEVVECIQTSLESDDLVELRDTDLDAVGVYLRGLRDGLRGRLYYTRDGGGRGHAELKYAVLPTGEYLLPALAEELQEALCLQDTHFTIGDGARVRFTTSRLLYSGKTPLFVAATPEGRQ